ncbi:MAG: SecD/SecF fusion protein [Solirubrobacterales bacterium]|nr:SecD/SecF fusion protein [Solirubrobacterales bacterium]
MNGGRGRCRSALVLALIAAGATVFGSASGAATPSPPCSTEPGAPLFELVYLLQPGEERITARTRRRAAAVLCERLRRIGGGDAEIRLQGRRHMRVLLPRRLRGGTVQRVADRLAVPGQLGFYDWEADLIGPERAIGGHPGKAPKASALARAEREWKEAGRSTHDPAEARLIFAGAFPRAYGAVRLASQRGARKHCRACSASTPRFYMFDRSASHRLIAGPVSNRAALHRGERRNNIVLKVPVGTVIVSEQPANGLGELLTESEPGWFALRDRPALTAADIVDPKQEIDELGQPAVTFGFTQRGRTAFQRVTREIAQCGQAEAIGPVAVEEAEALSCHLAVILDGEVKTRAIINFADNPDGIDGRVGAQIAGGFTTVRDARNLAAILRTGALPIELTLVGQRALRAQNS